GQVLSEQRPVQAVELGDLSQHLRRGGPAGQVARHRLDRDGGEEQEERSGRDQPEHQDAGDDTPDEETHHVHGVIPPPEIGESAVSYCYSPTRIAWSRFRPPLPLPLRLPRLRRPLAPANRRSVLGSIASLMPSPSRLNASVVISRNTAGKTTYHQDVL